MEIRPMAPEDLPVVAALEQAIYPEPWSEGVFAHELGQPHRTYLTVVEGESIIGYGGMMVVFEDAHITTMSVAATHRGSGVAKRLMLRLVEEALSSEASWRPLW